MKDYAYRRSVSEAQERSVKLRNIARENAAKRESKSVTYRVYTEDRDNLDLLTGRYFAGYTKLYGLGVFEGAKEHATVIEVIGTPSDLQKVINLAGDIRVVNAQQSVLVTWSEVSRLDVTASLVNACQSAIVDNTPDGRYAD